MTEKDQTKAIAELDGWSRRPDLDYVTGHDCLMHEVWGRDQESCDQIFLGKYLTSRDAIVPVIAKESPHIQIQFVDFLAEFFDGWKEDFDDIDVAKMICASPAQMAEALLRATGKWRD